MLFFYKQTYWDHLIRNYKDFKDHNSKTGNNRIDFEFENEMNEIFGDDPTVVPHFTLDSLNKKRSIDVIDLVENDKDLVENNKKILLMLKLKLKKKQLINVKKNQKSKGQNLILLQLLMLVMI